MGEAVKKIRFIDTTLRDGQQSLWAMGMRTGMMLPVARRLDDAGFDAMEFVVPASQIKKMIRHLGEDFWQWVRLGAERITRTPLRMTGGYRGSLTKTPEAAGRLLVSTMANYGVRHARVSCPWNDFDDLREEIDGMTALGMTSIVNIIYSESPRHTDAYFVERAKAAAALKPWRICFKDVGGLLTPDRVRQLIPKVRRAIGRIPLEFHGHCNNGLGPVNLLEMAKAGVSLMHCAVPPLANGSSQPSVFAAVRNLRALGFDCDLDVDSLLPVAAHFDDIARHEGLPVGRPSEFDQSVYAHQVPGGMISNMRHQMKIIGMEHRMDEALEESARVRAEFGYPIMVTPLSQFVGSQAAINVMTGARYGQVTDEVIQYALGHWGREATVVMDQDIRDRILNRPRAVELGKRTQEEPTLAELRRKYGAQSSDEDLLLNIYGGGKDAAAIAAKLPRPTDYVPRNRPLLELLKTLTQSDRRGTVSMTTADFSLTLKRGGDGSVQ